jgi:hypothetical protein
MGSGLFEFRVTVSISLMVSRLSLFSSKHPAARRCLIWQRLMAVLSSSRAATRKPVDK